MSRPTGALPASPARAGALPASPARAGAAASSLLSTLTAEALSAPGGAAPLSPREAELEAWMAPGGRLRIGADGVPIKFTLHKVAAAKSLSAAAARAAPAAAPAKSLAAWRS